MYESNKMHSCLSVFLSDANMPVSGKHYGLYIARACSLKLQISESFFSKWDTEGLQRSVLVLNTSCTVHILRESISLVNMAGSLETMR